MVCYRISYGSLSKCINKWYTLSYGTILELLTPSSQNVIMEQEGIMVFWVGKELENN